MACSGDSTTQGPAIIVSRPSPNVTLPTEKDLDIDHKIYRICWINQSPSIRLTLSRNELGWGGFFTSGAGFSAGLLPKTLISFDPELSARFSRKREISTTRRPDGDSTPASRNSSIPG